MIQQAAWMYSISFESPDQGSLAACLVKNVEALLGYVMSPQIPYFTSINRFSSVLVALQIFICTYLRK